MDSFIGANFSCMKVCDPKDPNAANYCYNRLDRIGVSYTCPNAAQMGVFEMCDSDNQDFPGIYTVNGVTTLFSQPPESLGPITSMPYTARIPASSNCVTFQSSDLFAQLPTPTGAGASPAVTGSGPAGSSPTAGASKGSSGGSAAASRTGSSGSASPTGGADNQSNGAGAVRTSAFATVAGVVFAMAFFA